MMRRWQRVVMPVLTCLAMLVAGAVPADTGISRVVTLSPHLAELVALLDDSSLLVGVSDYSDSPASVQRIPRIGGAGGFDLEAILALQPDLVLGWQGGNREQDLSLLRSHGLNVHSIPGETLDDIRSALLMLGELLDKAPAARREASRFDERLRTLNARFADRPRRVAFIEISRQPLMGLAGRHPFSAALQLCGIENILRDSDRSALHVDLESVLARQPDFILLQQKPSDPLWSERLTFYQIDGVNRRPLSYDANLALRQTPRLLDAVEQVCRSAIVD